METLALDSMLHQQIELPWEEPDWLAQVSAWIGECLEEHGWQITGPVEVLHQRPWSTFATLSTDRGAVYFKAPAPAYGYEAALTAALARWRADCTVPLLGIDLQRGWLLSADAGVTLRSLTRAAEQATHWLTVLPLYAELQIDMADRLPRLLGLGLRDRRLATLPQQYAALLDDEESLLLGQASGLTPDEHRRLRDLESDFRAACRQLASFGLPETLVHEEVHENNVIVRDGRYTFTDWSDASVGHPFFSWLVTERTLVHWLHLEADGSELHRLRDAYLEPWTVYAPRGELLHALSLAYRLGMVNRALSWHHGLASIPERYKADYADSVPGWLQDFLEAESTALD